MNLALHKRCLKKGRINVCRWDRSQSATVDNLVLLTAEEADEHDATTLEHLRGEEPEFVASVEAILVGVRFAFGIDSKH